jgi:hypothetical protein
MVSMKDIVKYVFLTARVDSVQGGGVRIESDKPDS